MFFIKGVSKVRPILRVLQIVSTYKQICNVSTKRLQDLKFLERILRIKSNLYILQILRVPIFMNIRLEGKVDGGYSDTNNTGVSYMTKKRRKESDKSLMKARDQMQN